MRKKVTTANKDSKKKTSLPATHSTSPRDKDYYNHSSQEQQQRKNNNNNRKALPYTAAHISLSNIPLYDKKKKEEKAAALACLHKYA